LSPVGRALDGAAAVVPVHDFVAVLPQAIAALDAPLAAIDYRKWIEVGRGGVGQIVGYRKCRRLLVVCGSLR
jgi:hypothetical protein